MKNWFILHVIENSEQKVIKILKRKLNSNEYTPFIPTKEIFFKRQGISSIQHRQIFPGFIFIQTNCDANRILDELRWLLSCIKQVHSVLHYGDDKKDVALREDERLMWERLLDPDEFCIKESTGIIDNGALRVISGPLVGLEDRIKKINNPRHEATVELELMDKIMKISLLLTVVK